MGVFFFAVVGSSNTNCLVLRQDLKGGAMFWFEGEPERPKPRARPARKSRQGFYWKANAVLPTI